MIGRTVSHYHILSELGAGAMGIVYLAEDTRLKRHVAIKMLTTEYLERANQNHSRLLREALAISQINHPNIATIYDLGETADGQPFIAMEYIEGETLADILKHKRLSVSRSVEIIAAVASALSEAHSKGIIHRDIKPSNIIINKRGDVKVLDFGLAKQIEGFKGIKAPDSVQGYGETQTREGIVVGTPLYLSPEQALGGPIDQRSDIFSLGSVFYECLTGQPPFQAPSMIEICAKILRDEPPPPSQLNTAVKSVIDRIVLKALAKDSSQRYQTAKEFGKDLGLSDFNETSEEIPFTKPSINERKNEVKTFSIGRGNTKGDRIVATTEGSKPKTRFVFSFRLFLLFALVVMLSVFLVFTYLRMTRVRTVAVLPIVNKQSDPNIDYLSDGITERIITKLSRLSKVKVKAFTTVFGYKGSNIDPQKVGRDLNVDVVLSSRMHQQGDEIILNTELIDTNDGTVLWKDTFSKKMSELLNLEDLLAENVSSNLPVWINKEEKKALAQRPTANDEAYKQYLRGRYLWRKRDTENIRQAIKAFESAIDLDPTFANAYAGLADCYVLLNSPAYDPISTQEAMEKAKAAAKQALEIDLNSFEAHTSIAIVNLRYDWNFIESEQHFKRAIELNPDYAPAHFWYSNLLVVLKRFDEAITESEKGRVLDPLSVNSDMNVGRAYYYARRPEMALPIFNKILVGNPNDKKAMFLLGITYIQMGRYNDAIQTLEPLYSSDPLFAAAALGFAYGKTGNREKAQKILDQLEQISKQKTVPAFERAIVYTGLDDKDKTFYWFNKAIEERFFSVIYVNVEPYFDNLHGDHRFTELIQKLNIP